MLSWSIKKRCFTQSACLADLMKFCAGSPLSQRCHPHQYQREPPRHRRSSSQGFHPHPYLLAYRLPHVRPIPATSLITVYILPGVHPCLHQNSSGSAAHSWIHMTHVGRGLLICCSQDALVPAI